MNDSKATNINSTWYALESFNKPVVLILGGVVCSDGVYHCDNGGGLLSGDLRSGHCLAFRLCSVWVLHDAHYTYLVRNARQGPSTTDVSNAYNRASPQRTRQRPAKTPPNIS